MKYWRKPLDSNRVASTRGDLVIFDERCKGCGFCVEYCPRDVLALSDRFNRKGYHPPEVLRTGECLNCSLCEMICPEFAIFCIEAVSSAGHPNEVSASVGAEAGEARR